jgi:hypothetical protein
MGIAMHVNDENLAAVAAQLVSGVLASGRNPVSPNAAVELYFQYLDALAKENATRSGSWKVAANVPRPIPPGA